MDDSSTLVTSPCKLASQQNNSSNNNNSGGACRRLFSTHPEFSFLTSVAFPMEAATSSDCFLPSDQLFNLNNNGNSAVMMDTCHGNSEFHVVASMATTTAAFKKPKAASTTSAILSMMALSPKSPCLSQQVTVKGPCSSSAMETDDFWDHYQRHSQQPSYSQQPRVDEDGETQMTLIPSHRSPHDAIPRITPETMVELLDGSHADRYGRLHIIDCRYPYEWQGGHIPSSTNITSLEAATQLLLVDTSTSANDVFVFHCEFSSERGPRMALHVRRQDRLANAHRYPHLTLPHVYILDGGYKAFWLHCPHLCLPAYHYRPMRHALFKPEMRAHQKTHRKHPKRRHHDLLEDDTKVQGNAGDGDSVDKDCFIARRRLRQIVPTTSSSTLGSELP